MSFKPAIKSALPQPGFTYLISTKWLTKFAVGVVAALAATMPVPEVRAQDNEINLTIWPGRYTPTRVMATAGGGTKSSAIQGIDPIIAAYEELHPNVKIEVIGQSINADTRRWMVTQLTGGVAPDIMWYLGDWAVEDFRKKWLVPINDYLEQPNPYIEAGQPGSERWRDLFFPQIEVWKAPNGELYVVLADQIQVGIYYNKDLFEKAGVDGVPKTWEDMIEAADKVQATGAYGFAATGNNLHQLTWVSGWLTNFFYHPEIGKHDLDGDGVLDKVEMATAVKEGTYSYDDARNRARLEELKRFAGYWQPGALGADMGAAVRLFVTGRAGMLVVGTWMLPTITEDENRDFDFGIFYLPVVDSATSDLIPDGVPPTNKSAGYGSFQYAVTNSAVANGEVEAAIDFLMFATQPDQLNQMILEGGIALPGVHGAPPNPELEDFKESVTLARAPYQEDDSMFDSVFAEKFLVVTSPYLSGRQSLDETVERLNAEMEQAADRVLGN